MGRVRERVKAITYRGADGEKKVVRNLVKEFTDALMTQMGIDTVDGAMAFFKRHPRSDFSWLKVGVKMPSKPEYYSDQMDMEAGHRSRHDLV